MKSELAILLGREQIARLLTIEECTMAIENAFRVFGEGKAAPPGVLGMHATDGGFHIKAGILALGRTYFAAKVNGNFPANGERFGLPTIQGVIVLCDGANGSVLALMDSTEITALRTAAATAVAVKYLARRDSEVATICGCGNQGRAQLRALAQVISLKKVYACDMKEDRARNFAREFSTALGISVEAVRDLRVGTEQSDVCVTCTTSRQPLLTLEHIRPGTFVAAVGADNSDKQELHPALMAASKVVVDVLEQCATIGDLHHAIAAGLMKRSDVFAELGEVVAGRKPGRTSDEEIIVFDSTGMALQDVAAAALVYEKAVAAGCEFTMDFAA